MKSLVVDLSRNVEAAIGMSEDFSEGEIPLDKSSLHLFGLGGSAIAGDMIRDFLAPVKKISVHRGTLPPRDRRGVVVSSYSGNTIEIARMAHRTVGGLKSVIFLTSGGELAQLGWELAQPVWKMPTGLQPRAALGWSLGFLVSIMVRWRISNKSLKDNLERAAKRLADSIAQTGVEKHPLVRAALPIAQSLKDKNTLIFHSLGCTGAARRLAAQITENSKQPAFAVLMPEGLHNAIEGIAGGDPERWSVIYLADSNDPPFLRDSLARSADFLQGKGFSCVAFPAAGKDKLELTLSRIFLADFVSLFIAALRGIDPTPIETIMKLKETESQEEADTDQP